MVITAAHLSPIIALIAGILILVKPRLLNYVVAFYFIAVGLLLAATEQIDVAVVDINISGQVATAVAGKLIEREIPFLFISGYEKMRGTRYASIPLLCKLFEPEDLHDEVERVLRHCGSSFCAALAFIGHCSLGL